MILQRMDEFCKEMNQSNKTNDKIKILEKYGHHDESFRKLLLSVYHSSVVFNVTSKNVKKYKETKYNKDSKDNRHTQTHTDSHRHTQTHTDTTTKTTTTNSRRLYCDSSKSIS